MSQAGDQIFSILRPQKNTPHPIVTLSSYFPEWATIFPSQKGKKYARIQTLRAGWNVGKGKFMEKEEGLVQCGLEASHAVYSKALKPTQKFHCPRFILRKSQSMGKVVLVYRRTIYHWKQSGNLLHRQNWRQSTTTALKTKKAQRREESLECMVYMCLLFLLVSHFFQTFH